LKEGYKKTKFFHKFTLGHKNSNKIMNLKATNGLNIFDEKEMENKLNTFLRIYSWHQTLIRNLQSLGSPS